MPNDGLADHNDRIHGFEKMSEKLTLQSVYKEYWKCRDFELQHFWQRSIFLTAFLAGCFTLYVGLLMAVLENWGNLRTGFVVLNLAGFAISVVGILLSCLWIMMAKGSKAWYERWEMAIYAFPEAYASAFEDGAGEVAGFRIDNIDGYEGNTVSSWLWNTHGGAYSPSRINIAIGHLSLLIWILIAVMHVLFLRSGVDGLEALIEDLDGASCGGLLCFFGMIGFLFVWIYARTNLRSGVLTDN